MEPGLGHVGKFFDGLRDEYTQTIVRCFPRYQEMQWALLQYLPQQLSVRSVVDLGCGTGNLSLLLSRQFPDATLHLVDVSADSMEACRQRLEAQRTDVRATYHTADIRDWAFPSGGHDLIVSSIAIHHIDSAEKQTLFSRIFEALNDGGVFSYADQFAGATDEIYQRHIQLWKESTFAAGASHDEWEMWMQHQAEHDHHDTLSAQLGWLNEAGFADVDCPWRYLLWSVVTSRKPALSNASTN